jgi:hypothetical protein
MSSLHEEGPDVKQPMMVATGRALAVSMRECCPFLHCTLVGTMSSLGQAPVARFI